MTIEFVAFHAHGRPDAIAIDLEGKALTYRELAHALARLVEALAAREPGEGSVVVVSCQNAFLQLVLLLACEALRVVRAPLAAPCSAPAGSWLHSAELVVTEGPVPGLDPERHFQVDMDWYAKVTASAGAPLAAPARRAPDAPELILTTSGTTGQAKRILLNHRQLAGRVHERVWQYQLSHRSALWIATPLSVGVVLTSALCCLELGAKVVFDTEALVAQRFDRISHVVLLPVHLRRLLDAMPASAAKPRDLFVISIGSELAGDLRERVLARLATTLFNSYGSNEVGPVCSIDARGIGRILPGVEVRIEDSEGRVLPAGQMGTVAVRGPWMCAGYLDDPALSAAKFRQGWFYPGDRACLHGRGELELAGRADELLNIGGLKVSPATLEEALARRLPGVDLAVCAVPGSRGVDELCVVIAGWSGSSAALSACVAEVVGRDFGKVHVVPADAVPRTPSGKVQRGQLRAALAGLGL